MIEVNNNCKLIICALIIASILIITLFLNWYANYQTNKEVARQRVDQVEKYKIDRYEKKYFRKLRKWQIIDRLNDSQSIVIIYDLPKDIGEEIIDYSLELIEEKMK